MEVDIQLRSGLLLKNAAGMLIKKFEQWPWKNYDGDRPRDPNVIDSQDIKRVYQLGSRTRGSAYVELLQTHGETLSLCLKAIPTKVALENEEFSSVKEPLVELFDVVLSAKYVKMAGATKLLYPFRPLLIPVIDSVVESYYWYATSIHEMKTFRKLEKAYRQRDRGYGEYVFEILCLMKNDLEGAREAIDKVLGACEDQDFARASRVRVLESLIWYYYARAGAAGSDSDEGHLPGE